MDVHRLKFLDIKPLPVLSVACNKSKECPKIAVSRSDGSIELWTLVSEEDRELCHHSTIPGKDNVSVESLVWSKQRLFSAGLTGTLNEWDTVGLCCTSSVDALGSPIWCLDSDAAMERLAVGTDDGKICLYDTTNSTLSFSRTLSNQNCRILSLCFHPKGFHIAIGCSDSTARILDVESGQCILRISVGKSQSAETLVWNVKFLSDFKVVTGSSNGKVQFWNGQYGTLKHSYQSHLADVLTMSVSEDETSLYASGVDAKVVQFKQVKDDSDSVAWIQCQGVRAHSHDVKSLSVINDGCLVSGGIDTELVLYNTRDFDYSKTNRFSPFIPWLSRFKYASSSNVLMYQGPNLLKFWRITPRHRQVFNSSNSCSPDKDAIKMAATCQSPCPSDSNLSLPSVTSSLESDLLMSSGLPVNFLEIKTPSNEHILSSGLSNDGRIVIISCSNKTWIYSVGTSVLCIYSSDIASRSVAIKHDNSQIVMGLSKGGLSKSQLPVNTEKRCNLTFETITKSKDKLSNIFCQIQYSPCGQYLLVLNLKFRMFLYDTSSFECLAKLPRLDDYRIPCPVFDPASPIVHIFCSSNNELYSYDISNGTLNLTGSLSVRSKAGGHFFLNGFCESFNPHCLIGYDTKTLVVLKNQVDSSKNDVRVGKKRARDAGCVALPYKMFKCYSDILFVTPLKCGELLVVEKSWSDVLNGLPPVLERKQYAT